MAQPFPNELKHLYDNTEFIGSGGFARVFKARRRDGRVVAVKIPLSLDEATGKSFLREITSWQRLSHKNIVSLFDANILPIPYLEQEYCDGGSLENLKKPLEISKACEIVFDIAEGLKYAHKQGIVHRDLKPQNILLTEENVPKITDWGMSRVIAESRSSTQHGYTPAYASPEQVSPKKFGKPDERTDIYQLGVIFYNLLTNDLPFKGDDLAEIASAIVMEKPAAPSELNPKAKEVEHVVLKCLSKNKEERYQSVKELQMELAGFIKQRKEREKKALEKLQQETVRREEAQKREKEENERLRRLKEQEEREQRESKAREEAERKEREKARLLDAIGLSERAKAERRERERQKAKQEEELRVMKEVERDVRKTVAVALVLGALLLGIWALAPGATNTPETPITITPPPYIQKTFTNSIGMEFLLIPEGEFDMGMGAPGNDREPVHRVKIAKAFYISKYEVTQKRWREFMGNNHSYFKGDNLPVDSVSWNDAQEFIKKLNEKEGIDKYRLPSEAEWEYAARAGTTTRYFFGDSRKWDDYAWCASKSGDKTHEVGQKKPNPWGLYDIYGNVHEWVQDIYHDSYSGAPTDGSAWEVDGWEGGSYRVTRGGSYAESCSAISSADRGNVQPDSRIGDLGFRLVRDL